MDYSVGLAGDAAVVVRACRVRAPSTVGSSAERSSRVTCACASAMSRATLMFGLRSIAMRSASASVSRGPEDAAGPAGACAAGSCREGICAFGICACCERIAHGKKTSNNDAHAADQSPLHRFSHVYSSRSRFWLVPLMYYRYTAGTRNMVTTTDSANHRYGPRQRRILFATRLQSAPSESCPAVSPTRSQNGRRRTCMTTTAALVPYPVWKNPANSTIRMLSTPRCRHHDHSHQRHDVQ